MKNNYISQLHFISKHLVTLLVLVLLFIGVRSVSAQAVGDYGTSKTGANNWSTAGNWIVCVTANTWDGATVPTAAPNATKNVWIRTGSAYTVNATATCLNLNIQDGGTLTIPNNTLTVSGTTTVGGGTSGTLSITSATGSKTFTGLVTVNARAIWNNSANEAITFKGGITNSGTFTVGTGIQTFSANPQSLTGDLDMSGAATVFNTNVTNLGTLTLKAGVSGTGSLINAGTVNTTAQITISTVTNQGTLNASSGNLTPTTLTNTSTGILNISGDAYTYNTTFTNQGTLTYTSSKGLNTPFTNTGTINVQGSAYYIAGITNNTRGTLNVSVSPSIINSLTATAADNTVNYSGAGDQTIKNGTYSNLILSGSGTKTFAGSTTINNNFTINTGAIANLGTFTHTANAYYLNSTAQASGSWGGSGSAANYTDPIFAAATGILNVATGSCTPGTWNGMTSSDWNTGSNWCNGVVPTSTTDVIIPNATYKPIIGATGGLCNNITINSNSSLTILGSYSLTVSGSFTNNGTFTANNSTTTLNGNSNSTIGGSSSTTFNSLTINKGAAASTVTNSASAKAFSATNLTITQGNLILQATDADYTVTNDLIVSANGTLTHSVNWDTSLNKKLVVGGNITIAGKYDYSAAGRANINMTGSGKTITTGTSPLSILTLTGTITANSSVTINDNFWASWNINGGSFTTGANTVTANAGIQNAGGTITISTGGTLNVTQGLYIGLYSNNGTVNLGGTGILNADFVNIGNGTTATGAFNQSGGTANISGDLTISTTGTYTCTNSPTINVGGNWTNNKTFTRATSSVTLNGNSNTNINGSVATIFNNLTLSGTGTKTFANATTISNNFTINTGAVANLGSGLTHTAKTYYLDAVQQYKGSWGSSASNAVYTNDTNFDVAASGILNTTTGTCGPGYWVGASGTLGTDWNTASNWCDGHVPTESTNVYIPDVTYEPIIGAKGGLCKNITIETNSSLTQGDAAIGASNLFVYGNWTNNGTYTAGIGTTTFAGASAQTIGGSKSTTFYNLTIENESTNIKDIRVTLNNPTTVTRALLLVSGIVNTTSELSITTSTFVDANGGTTPLYGVIMGGSSKSYINGPIKWSLPTMSSTNVATYKFPVGTNSAYLPYSLVNPQTNGSNMYATVQAFSANPNPANNKPNSPLTALSSTEYWKLSPSSGFQSTSITLGKGDQPVSPYNTIASNQNISGNFDNIGGTAGFYEVSESTRTSNVSNYIFTLGQTNAATINVSPIVLGGFGYIFNFGPSAEQTFTVYGTSLPADIVITAPDNYEISTKTGINFGQTLTLPRETGNIVSSTTIYIRLKAGLDVGTYNGKKVIIQSTDGTTTVSKKIDCNGTVFTTTPSIIANGGLSCDSKKIELSSSSSSTDITNIYWTGPSNYYSKGASQTISSTTTIDPSMYGTYTVTGSIPTGANLIINGDFEQGNFGFLSSYLFAPGSLNAQGAYGIFTKASDLNGGFDATVYTKQMIVDGAPTANVTVWSETIKVLPNSTYQFTYWLRNIKKTTTDEPTTNPAILQLYTNNKAVGTPFTAPATIAGGWIQYYYNWDSGSNTSVTLDLRNQNIIKSGNDFALDNIDFRTVTQVSSSINVTGNSQAVVSISTSTPTNSVATGTNVTFTATPTNGGTAPLYQWYVNDVPVGENSTSSTFNYVPSNNDIIKVVMKSNTTCPADQTATASITMKVDGDKNYWMGAVGVGGTAWNNPANWTANKVPASGDDVEFASTTGDKNYGIPAKNHLYVENNKIIGNLINNKSGMNLIIPANTQLYVNNKITLTPVDPSAPYDQIQIKADPNLDPLTPIPNGSLIFHNSDKDNKVYGSVEMYTKSYLNTSHVDENDEFFWQYFGIPVESIPANPTFYGAYVRKANEAGDETDENYYWTELGNNDVLTAFDGYEICQTLDSKYLLFQGQLVNRDFRKTLIYSPGTNVKYPGQHLLANPYTAAIDVNKINFGSDIIDASVSLYKTGSYGQWAASGNGVTDGTGPGQYTTIPKFPAGNNGLPQEVPSMSSMLVRVRSSRTDANSVISFNYKDVINRNTTIQKVKAADEVTNTDLISTRIDLTGQHYSDRMWIFTEPSCTRDFDNGWDGRKMLGSSLAPQIYAVEPDGDYQVNSVSDMNNTDLAFQAGDEVEYTLKFTHENIQRQYAGVYLVDLIENKTVDVTENGSTYKFATAQSDVPTKRFKILTRYYEKNAPDAASQLKIFSAKSYVFIQNPGTFNGNCTLYNVAGQAVKNLSFGPGSITAVSNLRQGAYVISATTNGEQVSKRVIVQ